MAEHSFEVKFYRVKLSNGTIGATAFVGYLNCLDASANWTSQFTVYFLTEGTSLPPSSYNASNKMGASYRPISQMALYLDLLRNEKPVFAEMSDANPNLNALRTWPEPVGEGE
ncbi:MAG: hypothetical protein ABI882_14915 [Acidobacteriota bacterium]